MKTLQEFQKTGRNVAFDKDIQETLGMEKDELTPFGRIYDRNCYIELCADGEWMLTLGNQTFKNGNLTVLEDRLYRDHYLTTYIETYQIEIRGRVLSVGSDQGSFTALARFEIRASSYTEAVDSMTKFKNNPNVKEIKDLVKCMFDDTRM